MKDQSITGKQQRIIDQSSQNQEREVYAGSPLTKLCIHTGSLYTKLRICTHTLSQKEKCVYLGKLSFWSKVFGPWYFDPWYWTKVSGLRY